MSYHCPLGRFDPKPMDTDAVKRRGWVEDRILVIHLQDRRLTDRERETVRALGNKLYGDRA